MVRLLVSLSLLYFSRFTLCLAVGVGVKWLMSLKKCLIEGGRKQALHAALNKFKQSLPPPQTPIRPAGSLQDQASAVFESNCADLLVKAIYNGGDGWAISQKFRSPTHSQPRLQNDLTPDFVANIPYVPYCLPANDFAACLVPTSQTNRAPVVVKACDLTTPPVTPEKAQSAAGLSGASSSATPSSMCVVFEFSLDEKKWQEKLRQVNTYVEALGSQCVCMAGVVQKVEENSSFEHGICGYR